MMKRMTMHKNGRLHRLMHFGWLVEDREIMIEEGNETSLILSEDRFRWVLEGSAAKIDW